MVAPKSKVFVCPKGKDKNLDKICNKCYQKLPISSFYKAGIRGNKQRYRSACKNCYNREYTTAKRANIKKLAINYYGAYECSICKYSKCDAALHFHHVDKNSKEYDISNMYSFKEEDILKEMYKCVLLCANCHIELHHLKS